MVRKRKFRSVRDAQMFTGYNRSIYGSAGMLKAWATYTLGRNKAHRVHQVIDGIVEELSQGLKDKFKAKRS